MLLLNSSYWIPFANGIVPACGYSLNKSTSGGLTSPAALAYNNTDRSVLIKMTQQERSQRTRAQLLESARVCFSQDGYASASIARICEHAGVSKGAFYHHFPSKQALFLELLQVWLETLDASFIADKAPSQSSSESFKAMARHAGQLFPQASGQFPLYLEFMQRAVHDPAVWERTLEPFQSYQKHFAGLIRTGIARGDIKEISPGIAARAIVALAVGLLLQAALEPEGEDWSEITHTCMQMLLAGIEIPNEGEDS